MKHTTLYRKWRPRRFGEIAGQGSVVRTLRRAIETDRVAHAYLFSGPRGTGKTSSAKVLSMGLNCVNGPTPEPCGECDSCRAIVGNSSMDVVEMDAASNRGIDEIRDLRDRVNLAPAGGRTKVYIIDEVHMLTTEAFNALLKMLEEPPEHVVFVLATTEKHKVLPTIISRCQSFDFRRPSVETLSAKLGEIAAAEGIEVEPEALTVIARAGGGSFRDAEGLLDQLSSYSEGKVTAALVRELLGNVGPDALIRTTDALVERRVADALRDLDALSNEGRDLGRFASELISHLRNLMLLPHAPEVALAEVGADERAALEEQSERVPTAEAVRSIEALGEAVGRIKRGSDAKLELELCFMKLARDYAEPSVEALMSRLEALEIAARNGGFSAGDPKDQRPAQEGPRVPKTENLEPEEAPEQPEPPQKPPDDIENKETGGEEAEEDSRTAKMRDPGSSDSGSSASLNLGSRWTDVMQELKRRRQALTAAVYGEARVESFDGEVLKLVFPGEESFHVKMAQERKHLDYLTEVLEARFGVKPRLEVSSKGESSKKSETPQKSETSQRSETSEKAPSPPKSPEPYPEEPVSGGLEPSSPGDESGGSRGGAEGVSGGVSGGDSESERPPAGSPEVENGDDIIRSQREVFEMAQARFDLDQNDRTKGS